MKKLQGHLSVMRKEKIDDEVNTLGKILILMTLEKQVPEAMAFWRTYKPQGRKLPCWVEMPLRI